MDKEIKRILEDILSDCKHRIDTGKTYACHSRYECPLQEYLPIMNSRGKVKSIYVRCNYDRKP